jgi:hypothetical protein
MFLSHRRCRHNLKKRLHNFRVEATVSERYELIDAEEANYPISRMCQWLDVSKSGFYEWRGRPASATAQRREQLKPKIEKAFDDSFETYGYRRVCVELLRDGVDAGEELVRRLMRELDLVACQPRGVQACHDRRRRRGEHPRPGPPRLHR